MGISEKPHVDFSALPAIRFYNHDRKQKHCILSNTLFFSLSYLFNVARILHSTSFFCDDIRNDIHADFYLAYNPRALWSEFAFWKGEKGNNMKYPLSVYPSYIVGFLLRKARFQCCDMQCAIFIYQGTTKSGLVTLNQFLHFRFLSFVPLVFSLGRDDITARYSQEEAGQVNSFLQNTWPRRYFWSRVAWFSCQSALALMVKRYHTQGVKSWTNYEQLRNA